MNMSFLLNYVRRIRLILGIYHDSYISGIIDSGLAFNPVRVNIL